MEMNAFLALIKKKASVSSFAKIFGIGFMAALAPTS